MGLAAQAGQLFAGLFDRAGFRQDLTIMVENLIKAQNKCTRIF